MSYFSVQKHRYKIITFGSSTLKGGDLDVQQVAIVAATAIITAIAKEIIEGE